MPQAQRVLAGVAVVAAARRARRQQLTCRASDEADPEDLRWALELAERAKDLKLAEKLRSALPEVEMARPVSALDSLVRARAQKALAQVLDAELPRLTRLAAVRTLQSLATPPAACAEAEDALHQVLCAGSSDEDVVELAEAALWAAWLPSGEETVDADMREGLRLMSEGELPGAIKAFSKAVVAAPSYAEGWNKRATALFLAEQFDESIEDCHRVLELKPRHFGCLQGLGICYLRKGNENDAVGWLRRALDVNPRSTSSRDMQQIVEEIDSRCASAKLRPRIQAVLEELRLGSPDSSVRSPRAGVCAEWDAHRVEQSDDKWAYFFRVRVERLEEGPSDRPLVSCMARYYALQQGSTVFPLSRVTQGTSSFKLAPGEKYQYSFMLGGGEAIKAVQGGLLLRCQNEIFELGLERLSLFDSPAVGESDLQEMNEGYRFMGYIPLGD